MAALTSFAVAGEYSCVRGDQAVRRVEIFAGGQFTAEIAGYGDLDGDGLEDGLAFFTYEAERLARVRFIVA